MARSINHAAGATRSINNEPPFYMRTLPDMRTLPAGFIAPCLPTKTDKLPSGSDWLHEIKQRDGAVCYDGGSNSGWQLSYWRNHPAG
jgi:hypothetical protein